MKTVISGRHIETKILASDKALLRRYVGLFGPLVRLPKIGRYLEMEPEEVWQRLVSQVCVMGSALHMERLQANPAAKETFDTAISLKETKKQKRQKAYLAEVLAEFSVTRFPNQAAGRLAILLGTKTVFNERGVALFRELSHKDEAINVRHLLMQRCPLFGLKGASDFMIAVGLSRDVIALDTRVVGVFQKYCDYNLNAGRIQGKKPLYYSLESALRKCCSEIGASLALLDRIFFRYSGISAFELLAKHPSLFSDEVR